MKFFDKKIFWIPLLIYFYILVVIFVFNQQIQFGFLSNLALFFSYLPIFSIFIFYKYFMKNHLKKLWIRALICLSFFLVPFLFFLSLVIPQLKNDKIQAQLLGKAIEKNTQVGIWIPENDLDKLASAKILSLGGLLAGILISFGGLFMLLDDFAIFGNEKNFILKKYFSQLLKITLILSIPVFIILNFDKNYLDKYPVFIYNTLNKLTSFILTYSVSFIISSLLLTGFYVFSFLSKKWSKKPFVQTNN